MPMKRGFGWVVWVVLLLLGIFVVFLGFPGLGQLIKTHVLSENLKEKNCSEQLAVFDKEYGIREKSQVLFLDNISFHILSFSNGWTVPFDEGTCRIAEEHDSAFSRFQIWDYSERIADISFDFYESTENCYSISLAKGASTACDISMSVNQVLEMPVTKVIAEIPTKDAEALVSSLVGKGWKGVSRSVTGKAVTILKKAKNSDSVSMGLTFVEAVGCPFEDTPKRAIFDFSDKGNVFFTKAKNHSYTNDTILQLQSINEYILTFELLEIERNTTSDSGNGIFNYAVSKLGVGIDTVASEIEARTTPDCVPSKQIEKFNNYIEKVTGNFDSAQDHYEQFNAILLELKENATKAIYDESRARNESQPSVLQLFFFKKAAIYYFFSEPERTQSLYDQQLYLSSKKLAEENAEKYRTYWNEITFMDYAIILIFFGFFILVIYFKWLRESS